MYFNGKYFETKNKISDIKEETFVYNCKLVKGVFLQDFICPISLFIMNDPIILSDGHSYEREYAIKWLKQSDISPKTGEKLKDKNIMISNYTLKAAIYQLKEKIYKKKLNKQIGKLKIIAKNGNSCAANKLGAMYRDGIGFVIQNYEKALEYFQIAERLNNSNAFVNIGNFYEFIEYPRDYNKAKEYYEKAVKLDNNSDALVNLGLFYFRGQGIEKDITKAIDYFIKAEKLGNIEVLMYFGILYETEYGDIDKAIEFYEKAAKLGNFMSMLILCDYYIENSIQDTCKVKEYLGKAAKIADYKQLDKVAEIYELRLKNYLKAKKYYKKAIKLGNYDALIKIANIYLAEKNYSIAFEYYEKAVDLGYNEALYDLSYFYEKGLGVEIDKAKAQEYKEKANDKGFYRTEV
jgi:TPR repeat protein